MALPKSRQDREQQKFVEDSDGDVAVRILMEDTLTVVTTNYTTLYDFPDANTIYIGDAIINSSSAAAVWRIKKFTLVGGNPTAKEWAGGADAFDQIWNNRAGLSYS
jgi:hypothetical protein